jgi:hypothetical protein
LSSLRTPGSRHFESIQIHHLTPGGYKITHERPRRVAARIEFYDGPQHTGKRAAQAYTSTSHRQVSSASQRDRIRKITTNQLINPVVQFDFHMISCRGRELPPGPEEFTSFLKSYIFTWIRRADAHREPIVARQFFATDTHQL